MDTEVFKMSGFLGEFLGTMVLIVLGTGCGAAIN